MEKRCLGCNEILKGRQTKFCSLKCKNFDTNNKHQNYVAQQRRGYERRTKLVQMKGGSCEICGYKKNQAALSFHHDDPTTKRFQIDLRRCSNSSWKDLLEETEKCRLLCLNCHSELHNPSFST
jgi:hypothetical protein